jgi:hypothetical protein
MIFNLLRGGSLQWATTDTPWWSLQLVTLPEEDVGEVDFGDHDRDARLPGRGLGERFLDHTHHLRPAVPGDDDPARPHDAAVSSPA